MRNTGIALIAVMFGLVACNGSDWDENETVVVARSQIQVEHPGLKAGGSADVELVQFHQRTSETSQFYVDVQSVFCDAKICKVDVVRLYFDELGEYQHHALQRNVDLEKAEGESFSATDYEKLDMILRNRASGLGRTHVGEFYSHQGGESNVDAISGATISLHTDDYVAGAALTCYTLWHWANGDIYSNIRARTGDKRTTDELRRSIQNGTEKYRVFALEQLIRRKAFDPDTIAVVIQASDTSLSAFPYRVVDYVEQLPRELYFNSLATLFGSASSELRLRGLYSLLAAADLPPPGFSEQLSQRIPSLTSYQEVDLLLEFFEQNEIMTPAIRKNVAGLLDHNDFIVARRAFWFLQRQSPQGADQARLEDFRRKHAQNL